MLINSPGPVDRNNLESLKAHYAFADRLCKLNFKLTIIVAICVLFVLYLSSQQVNVPSLELPLKLLNILMPLTTILLIAIQSFVMYYRKTMKTQIDQFPSK